MWGESSLQQEAKKKLHWMDADISGPCGCLRVAAGGNCGFWGEDTHSYLRASKHGFVLSWHVSASQVDHKVGGSIHKAPELPLWPSALPGAATSPCNWS